MSEARPFRVSVERRRGDVVVVVSGELDAATVTPFERVVAGSIEAGTRLIIDLADVELLDSAGIGALLRLRRDAGRIGATAVIRAPRDYQRQLFAITGLSHVLEGPLEQGPG